MVKTIDVIIPSIEISYSGHFDIKDFQAVMKKWLKKAEYDYTEKGFDIKTAGETKTALTRVEADKKLDDYHKLIIKPTITISNYKEVKVDGKKIAEGDVKVKVEAEIERDYDEKWKAKPLKRFLRGFFDKFIASEHEGKIAGILKKETHEFIQEIKLYFNIEG